METSALPVAAMPIVGEQTAVAFVLEMRPERPRKALSIESVGQGAGLTTFARSTARIPGGNQKCIERTGYA